MLIAVGFGRYRAAGYIPVWEPPVWTRHLALLLVWPAFVMFAAAYLPGRIKARAQAPDARRREDVGRSPTFSPTAISARSCCSARSWPGRSWRASAASAATRCATTAARRPRRPGWRNDLLAVVIGTAVWLAFAFWLHPWLIGVPVLPGRRHEL